VSTQETLQLLERLRAHNNQAPFQLSKVIHPHVAENASVSMKRYYDVRASTREGKPIETTIDLHRVWLGLQPLLAHGYTQDAFDDEQHPRGAIYHNAGTAHGIILLRTFEQTSGAWFCKEHYIVGTLNETLEQLEILGGAKSAIHRIATLVGR